jgi:CRP-like cAMP-binding protein
MGPEAFRRELSTRPAVKRLLHRYLYALVRQIIQAGACNRLHSVDQRCARWLLMTHDRVGVDAFSLTQEFLAVMLAVQRPTVNLALSMFKKAGFIHYVRGMLSILDRPGLESVACPCYATIQHEYSRVAVEQ